MRRLARLSWCLGRQPGVRSLNLMAAVLLAVATAHGGAIRGVVRAQPKDGVGEEPATGRYDSRKFKFVERVNYLDLRDFVVYVEQGTNPPPKTPPATAQIVQKDAVFTPHVLPIMAGTTVVWPNRDDVFHNVFSYSETKQFDLGLYKTELKRVTFDKPGRVDVFCSIHSKMHCVILVLENPHFATTDAQGAFLITNVPPGHVRLKAWHERLPPEVKEVVVPETGEVRVDFTLGVKNLPKY